MKKKSIYFTELESLVIRTALSINRENIPEKLYNNLVEKIELLTR